MRLLLPVAALILMAVIAAGASAYSVLSGYENETSPRQMVPLDGLDLQWTGRDLYPGQWVSFTVEGDAGYDWCVRYHAAGGAVALGPYTVAIGFEKPVVGIDAYLLVYKDGRRVEKIKIGHVGVCSSARFSANAEASLDCGNVLHIRVYGPTGAVVYTDSSPADPPVRVLASRDHYRIGGVEWVQRCEAPHNGTTTSPSTWATQRPVEPTPDHTRTLALGAGAVGVGTAVAYALSRRR